MPNHLSPTQRLLLANTVYKAVFDGTESFREGDVGIDLAYLLGAIVDPAGSFVDWSPDARPRETPRIVLVLKIKFGPPEKGAPVWQFIRL